MSQPALPPLRRFAADQVAAAVEALRPRLASGLIASSEVERLLILRALDGMWWACGLRSGRWYLHQSGAWSAMDRGAQMLEGIAPLGGQVPLKPSAPQEETTIASSGSETPSGPEAAVSLVELLDKSYTAGDLSTSDVTALLDELVLIDSSGALWAPGFQSRRWYRLAEDQWLAAEGAPGAGAGQEGRAPPLAAQALGRLQAAASRFPEPIAPAWSPPPGYPERLACPNCGGGLTTTSELCPFCGTSAPLLATDRADDGTPATTGPVTLPTAPPDPFTWRLAIIEGTEAGQVFTLRDGLRIGRASANEVRLTDARSSGRQARIETAGEGFRIVDLGSTNGTFLNGSRLTQPAGLTNGDRLGVGDTVLEVLAPSRCPHCGASASPADVYCGECGKPLAAATLREPLKPPVSAGASSVPGAPAPGMAVSPPPQRRVWTWVGLSCAVVLALVGIPALCLIALALLRGS